MMVIMMMPGAERGHAAEIIEGAEPRVNMPYSPPTGATQWRLPAAAGHLRRSPSLAAGTGRTRRLSLERLSRVNRPHRGEEDEKERHQDRRADERLKEQRASEQYGNAAIRSAHADSEVDRGPSHFGAMTAIRCSFSGVSDARETGGAHGRPLRRLPLR
jgi:hypothetical protein